ncbi:MAG: PAS domain S-box protein [Candidatus Methanoperedens sp.]|nr:PAS domain S-box protein [Candidatus Methanoperedens sp.]
MHVEDQIKALSLRYEAILAAVPDIIMEVDEKKVYKWANKAGIQFFGDDVIGKEASYYFESEQKTYEMVEPLFEGSEDIFYVESWQRRKDGEKRLLAWWCRVLKDSNGNVIGALSTARDLTERNKAEERLRYQAALLANVNDAIVASDRKYNITAWNTAAESLYGWKAEEVLGRSSLEIVQTEYGSIDKDEMLRTIAKAGRWQGEVTQVRKDGTRIPVEVSSIVLQDENNQIVGYASVNRDITERKRIEETHIFLSQCEHQHTDETFFESLARYLSDRLGMDYVCIYSLEGDSLTAHTVAVYNNGKFEDNAVYALKDIPCSDVIGKMACGFPSKVTQLFPRDEVLKNLRAESYVGVTLWGNTGKPIGLIAVIGKHPLTDTRVAESVLKMVAVCAAGELERLIVEETLRVKQYMLSEAQRIAHIGSWDADLTTGNVIWSGEMYRIFDVSPVTFVPSAESLINLITPEDREVMAGWIEGAISGEKKKAVEVRAITRDGRVRYVHGDGKIFFDENGKPIQAIGTLQDITERKQIEEALRKAHDELEIRVKERTAELEEANKKLKSEITERKLVEDALHISEERYRTMIEHSNDMIWTLDTEGRYQFINKRIEEFSGLKLDYFLGKSFIQFIDKNDLPKVIDCFHKALNGESQQYEVSVKKEDGSNFFLLINTAPIYSKEKVVGTVSFGRDITERKKAEEQLKESLKQKLKKSNRQNKLLCYLIEGTRGGKTRALILRHLAEKSYNAHQLAQTLQLDYKTIRHHLKVLAKYGMITTNHDAYSDIYFISKNIEFDLNKMDREL